MTLWGGHYLEGAHPEGVNLSQNNQVLREMGTAYFMHDGSNLYVGTVLEDPENLEPDNPSYYSLWMSWAFEDEPAGSPNRWTNCAWEGESYTEAGEGQFLAAEDKYPAGSGKGVSFIPWVADHSACWEDEESNSPGVVYDAAPRGAEAHYEMRVNLSNSPLDNVGLGDCFDLRWIWVYFSGYETRLRAVRTWPYDTAMLRTLFLSVVVPGGAAAARLLSELLLQ